MMQGWFSALISSGDRFEYAVDPNTTDTDYQNLLTAGSAFGQPTSAEQVTSNLFFKYIKYVGAFSRAYILYLFQKTGDEQFARLNVKNPSSSTFTLLPTNTPTLTDDGIAGNATSSFYNTQFNPSTQSVAPDYVTFITQVNTNAQQSSVQWG